MYSIVLMTALATTAPAPAFCHRAYCHGCVSACSCYGGGWGGSCHGCYGYGHAQGYGWAGGCYGYHGGCYGAFGNVYADPYLPGYYGCTGCYGCYGGYSCYGVPVPKQAAPSVPPRVVDPYPPINPKKGGDAEEINPLKEKKTGADGSVRAKIRIEIPEGGKLFVDGQRIDAPAGTRIFQTPALALGQTYFYDIRIEVERNGAIRREEQRVVIQAGQDALVSFPKLRSAEAETVQVNR